MRYFEE